MDKQEKKSAQTEFKSVCSVLDSRYWQYEKNEDALEVNFTADGKTMPLSVRVKVNPEHMTVTVFVYMLPVELPEGKDAQLAIAAALLNEEVVHGSFDVDFSARRMFFRVSTSYRNSVIDEEAYFYLIAVAFSTVDNVAATIKALCDGKVNVEQMLEKIEGGK